jgi:hypothetical protein
MRFQCTFEAFLEIKRQVFHAPMRPAGGGFPAVGRIGEIEGQEVPGAEVMGVQARSSR